MNGLQREGTHQFKLKPDESDRDAAIELKGERSLLETVAITADRLRTIERRLFLLEGVLFGASPACDDLCGEQGNIPNVKFFAMDAFGTSVRVERLVDEIISRIEC